MRTNFNPRSPRGGATSSGDLYHGGRIFQSTLPTRGSDATAWGEVSPSVTVFQSTLPTRGSDFIQQQRCPILAISIHAPHEGERRPRGAWSCVQADFNPRSPRGGATKRPVQAVATSPISIHAPHEGERPVQARHNDRIQRFQSTLPTRGSDRRTKAALWQR